MTGIFDDIRAKLAEAEAADVSKEAAMVDLREGIVSRDAMIQTISGNANTLNEKLNAANAEIARLKAGTPTPTPKRFRMFDSTVNYILGPNYERMPMISQSRLYPGGTAGIPNRDYILNTTMPWFRKEFPGATMVMIDNEHLNPNDVTAAEAIQYATMVKYVKESDPKLLVSSYGLPLRSQNHGAAGEAAWIESLRAKYKPLLDAMDFGTCSITALVNDLATFTWYCGSNLRMWRALSTKKNYPVICSTFHRNAKDAAGVSLEKKPIPAAFMQAALDACWANADGFIHWDWAAHPLDKAAPWYPVIEKFRAAHAGA